MRRAASIVAVITADIVGSSRYPARERRRVDAHLRQAFHETERQFGDALATPMTFRVTAGDEFQGVVSDVPRVLEILTYLRALAATTSFSIPLRFRAGVGAGRISLTARGNPYEQDGPAFVLAREALENLAKTRGVARYTMLRTGRGQQDAAADAVLGLADHVLAGWTVPQWEAVRWAMLGRTRLAIANELQVAHQNVTKRLRAAGWPAFQHAMAFLAATLSQVSRPG